MPKFSLGDTVYFVRFAWQNRHWRIAGILYAKWRHYEPGVVVDYKPGTPLPYQVQFGREAFWVREDELGTNVEDFVKAYYESTNGVRAADERKIRSQFNRKNPA